MKKANQDIRNNIIQNDLKYWQVANACNMSDTTFSRKLRFEISDSEKKEINKIILKLAKENEN